MDGVAPLPPAVAFDYTKWQQWFPDFVNVSEPYAQGCFWRAGQLCQNDCASPVVVARNGDTTQLEYFLYLLTCHICWLNAPQIDGLPNNTSSGSESSPLVGRISQATEGSVTVAMEIGGMQPQGMAFYAQTKWGLEYWQASAAYRQGPYVPGRAPPPGGWGYGYFGRRHGLRGF
jgi:Protein of unknown function (DUF4054)